MRNAASALVLVWLAACSGRITGGDPPSAGAADDGGPNGAVDAGRPGPGEPDGGPSGRGPIAGGGVRGNPIDGSLELYAVDETGSGISGASVEVGAVRATTDASGRAVIADAALVGPQTVSAQATGFAAETWFGVARDRVTLPLARSPRPAVGAATLSGSLDGWSSLPAPTFTEYNLALIQYSLTDSFGAPENTLPQPMNGDTPANLCLASALSSPPCNWQLRVRAGRQMPFAIIVRGNTRGTPSDTDDDTFQLVGFAIGEPLDVAAGANMSGIRLTSFAGSDVSVRVAVPPGPVGLDEALALPFLDTGGPVGQLMFPLPPLRPGSGTASMPAPNGPFEGASYRLIGYAVPGLGETHPFSTSFAGAVSPGASASLPPWLEPPRGVSGGRGQVSFTPPAGATTMAAAIVDRDGNPRWRVRVLDGSTAVSLPALASDPLAGASGLELRVTAVDVPGFDAAGFDLDNLDARIARIAEAATAYTP